MEYHDKISKEAFELMDNDSKIGLISTADDEGWPHITFISSLQGKGDSEMVWGQFCGGLSKEHIIIRPECAFLVLSADMRWLRGNAKYTHTDNTGELFDFYNNKPLFRYNTYFGYSRVHVMDLVRISDLYSLPMGKIVIGAISSRIKAFFCSRSENKALTVIGSGLFAALAGLKFISWADESGMMQIVPIIQAGPAGTDRVCFAKTPYSKYLSKIPKGAKCSVLAMNLDMESVLVKGYYKGGGIVEIDRVYNSMPPKLGYIYPKAETIEPVTEF